MTLKNYTEEKETIDEVVEKFEKDEKGKDMKWSGYLDIEHKGFKTLPSGRKVKGEKTSLG